jgi:hypothetical protein
VTLPISASKVARITDKSHWYQLLILVFKLRAFVTYSSFPREKEKQQNFKRLNSEQTTDSESHNCPWSEILLGLLRFSAMK